MELRPKPYQSASSSNEVATQPQAPTLQGADGKSKADVKPTSMQRGADGEPNAKKQNFCVEKLNQLHSSRHDARGEYPESTRPTYGPDDRKCLSVVASAEYYDIGTSDCPNPWWHMLSKLELKISGWAPPAWFHITGDVHALYEVPEPLHTVQPQEYTGTLPVR